MADDIAVVLYDVGRRLASRGVDAGMGALAETRVGQTPTGRAALGVLDALLDEYGDDAAEAILRRIHARQSRRIDAMVDEAKRENDAAAERARERLRAGHGGEGHE